MGFDTMCDVTYTFSNLTIEQAGGFLTEALKATGRLNELTYWTDYVGDHGFLQCYVSIKRLTGSEHTALEQAIRRLDLPLTKDEEKAFCGVPNCWEERAEQKLPEGGMLFDRHGEELSELHHFCALHVSMETLSMLKTLEVKKEAGEEKEYWTRVVSWQTRKKWWAQRLDKCQDGDYESGYFPYVAATPWLGPCTSREQAIEFAINIEE